jgi:hypothetical protein
MAKSREAACTLIESRCPPPQADGAESTLVRFSGKSNQRGGHFVDLLKTPIRAVGGISEDFQGLALKKVSCRVNAVNPEI